MANKELRDFCALTNEPGKFVKSHIIPVALTRLSQTGEKYVETGIGHGFKRRPTSWYDDALVTRSGEDILADIDTKAIEILRAHKLIWSSWGADTQLKSEDIVSSEGHRGLRAVAFDQPDVLQLFFLSLLWRAAASKRPELNDTWLDPSMLEDIRGRVAFKNPGNFSDYPIQLFQISTIGTPHNRTPIRESKEIPDSTTTPKETMHYVRIYFDGLVAHVHLRRGQRLSDGYLKLGIQQVGPTFVFLNSFEDSRALANLKEMHTIVSREQILARQIAGVFRKCEEVTRISHRREQVMRKRTLPRGARVEAPPSLRSPCPSLTF